MTRLIIWLFAIFCALWPISAQSRGLRVAIFDFELVDTSIEGATNGPRADETARLARLGDQLRALVTSSGKLEVIDIASVRSEARKASLQACGGCDADFAKKLGAELSITGTVQKVSNLILNINLYVRVVTRTNPGHAGSTILYARVFFRQKNKTTNAANRHTSRRLPHAASSAWDTGDKFASSTKSSAPSFSTA
jgi:hypothetical protein